MLLFLLPLLGALGVLVLSGADGLVLLALQVLRICHFLSEPRQGVLGLAPTL